MLCSLVVVAIAPDILRQHRNPAPRNAVRLAPVSDRARDLGIEIGRLPTGPANAITDVEGVLVGHTTLIEGDDVRTGVTVVVPPPEPLFAGSAPDQRQRRADGARVGPRLGPADDAGRAHQHALGRSRPRRARRGCSAGRGDLDWSLPVVGETWDGVLNDIDGFHVKPEHVATALGLHAAAPSRRARSAAARAWSATASRAGSARPRGSSRTAGRSACSCRRTTAGASAAGERRPRRRAHRARSGAAAGSPRALARSSSCSPPTRRSSRASASGSRAGPVSGSRAAAGWASTRAAISRSASPPATAASRRRAGAAAADAERRPHRRALRSRDRRGRGGDPERAARRRDDAGSRRQHGSRPARRAAPRRARRA